MHIPEWGNRFSKDREMMRSGKLGPIEPIDSGFRTEGKVNPELALVGKILQCI
jgi:hypothetical protein